MKDDTLDFELSQLLDMIFFRYGYDFRSYATPYLKRSVRKRCKLSGYKHVSELNSKILHDPVFFELFLEDMSVTVTEMFRDPEVFKMIRDKVLPQLQQHTRINIWHAGCATGEEVYSMSILLQETGLKDKTNLYATDFNNHSLEIAKKGIYPAKKIKQYTQNYQQAGGTTSFSDYYQADYGAAKLKNALKKNTTFAYHNLIEGNVFAEMHIILCRNVMIYFNETLQERLLNLFNNSLIDRGFLVLGTAESLGYFAVSERFETCYNKLCIYRKKENTESLLEGV